MSSFIPKINLGVNKRRSKSNLSFDSQTTANIGFVQPTLCRMLVPNASAKIKSRTLVRMSPLVNPTFGRLSQRDYYSFVRMSDLFKPWAEFLAGKPYSNYEESYIPTSLPRFNLNHVVAAIIANYSYIGVSVGSNPYVDVQVNPAFSYASLVSTFNSIVDSINSYQLLTGVQLSQVRIKDTNFEDANDPFSLSSFIASADSKNYEFFINGGDNFVHVGTTLEVPSYTDSDFSFFVPGQALSSGLQYRVQNSDESTINYNLDQEGIYLHFRLKPYAKNLRKILIGLGYSFNPFDTELYTPFKILAFYKAWFETFVPNRDVQFTDTQVYRIIKSFDNVSPTETITSQMAALFMDYFRNAFSYYTSPDYFSASIANLGDNSLDSQQEIKFSSPVEGNINDYVTDEIKTTYQVNSYNELLGKFGPTVTARILGIKPDGNIGVATGGSLTSPELGNSNLPVRSGLHALSLNMMLRLLRFTNKNNVIGRSIRDYAKAHYNIDDLQVDSNMSVKINSNRVDINFDDVMNTAASPDAFLGEYAGKGIGYKESDTTYFTAEDFGFIICMSVIVPESGYFQGSLKENKIFDKFEFFTEEFDALGYDVITRGEIKNDFEVEAENFKPTSFDTSKGFGFIPRYSHFKVGRNIVNGDLTLRSTREGLKGYYLDKIFPSIKEHVTELDSARNYESITLEEPDYLPSVVSTNIRKIDLNDNVGNYNRIFQYTDVDLDHFIIQKVFDFEVVAPWKSLSDSFDTFSSEDNGTITRNHQ